ncbi:hypothetical protein CWI39_2789p0010 [Hamiltosporidium magnivora]|uniref:Uncharacterized protein n=1 Tax=Hamiltosporidium magnivora TaxID=148818 RepID=A0A4Q9KU01_9MICR|nr:hypothetical protein CWI39_2789p0010 [Hamiltosporidium magnivora]
MSNSFSGKNTNENKYDFHVGETPECIKCENYNVLKCLVETSGSHDKNLPLTTIPSLRKQMKRGGDGRSKLTLKIKENLQTYVDLECTKTLYELAEWVKCTFNVDVSTSTIDRALREFHYTLKRVTLVPERRNTLSTIEIRTNYATSFREV